MTIIKRYSNRKLYNTSLKKYITLDNLAALIRTGEEIQVIDNKSGEDLTTLTLTQIILENEKKHQSGLPNTILTELIKIRSNEIKALQEFLTPPANLVHYIGDQISSSIPSKKDFDDLSSQIDALAEKLDRIKNSTKD